MILKSNSGTCIIIHKMRLNLFSQKQVTCQEKYKIAAVMKGGRQKKYKRTKFPALKLIWDMRPNFSRYISFVTGIQK